MSEKREFVFKGERQRLDLFLKDKNTDLTRSQIKLLIDGGFVKVNGRVAEKAGLFLKDGDIVEIEIVEEARKEWKVEPREIEVDVVYEDDDIIVVNKPPGMVTHPAFGHYDDTLINAIAYRYRDILNMNGLRPGLVHRLDKDVSGVMVIARHYRARMALAEQFKARTVKKDYIAIVCGSPQGSEGVINLRICRHPVNRVKMMVTESEDGREAITKWKLYWKGNKYSVLLVSPLTGRTHQIRVHLSHEKMPILNDALYGNRDARKPDDEFLRGLLKEYNGILLHACSLSFRHPSTNKDMEFKVEPPQGFMKVFRYITDGKVELP